MSVDLWTKQHLTHQKWLKTLSFWHIWLPNVLRATTACTFSTSNRHRIVKKWSEPRVFCTFWLGLSLYVTGVALGSMDLHFTWPVWHSPHWAGSVDALGCGWLPHTLRSRHGTWWHGPSLDVAGVAFGDMDLTLRGRRGLMALGWVWGRAGLLLVAAHFAWQAWHLVTWTFTLCGRRGTWWLGPSLSVAGVAHTALGCLWWHAGCIFSSQAKVDSAFTQTFPYKRPHYHR